MQYVACLYNIKFCYNSAKVTVSMNEQNGQNNQVKSTVIVSLTSHTHKITDGVIDSDLCGHCRYIFTFLVKQ